jgi:tetratricopeptide (TPR) repeat protein
MTHKFSSKEIHFLKTDSDDFNINPPEKYFSDLLWEKTIQFEAFENRLSRSMARRKKFLCAVIQISTPSLNQEKSKKIFEDTFNSIFDGKKWDSKKNAEPRGIWESLNSTSFVLAFWDYKTDEQASQLILSLKEKISAALKADILIGIAKFPYHNFSQSQTFDNAIKAIDHAAFFGHDTLIHFDATSLNICGDRLYQLKRYKQALNEYQIGLEIEPDNINLINSLGVCFGVMERLDKAKFEFSKAIKIRPDELMVIYNIGLLYQIQGDIDKAIIYLRKAHGIDPDVFEVELLLGSLLIKNKRPKQALPHLEAAGKSNPESALPYRMKGEIYLTDKFSEKAGLEFNKAIKINPGDANALSGYAKSLELQDKNLKIALSFAQNSINLEPENKLFKKRLKTIQKKINKRAMTEENIKTA